jgi:hypothetical protein
MTASSPMSVQAQPASIVLTTTQTPKAIIPAEIRNESTISIIGPLSFGGCVTFTPQQKGYIYVHPKMAKASTMLYYDPKLTNRPRTILGAGLP